MTKNDYLNNKYPVGNSFNSWNNVIFKASHEFFAYAQNTGQAEALKEYTINLIQYLISPDLLFNGMVLQRASLLYK